MAYYGGEYSSSTGSVFGGFPGGYNQTPEGLIYPSDPIVPTGVIPGVANYGAPNTIIGQGSFVTPLSSGVVDPNLGIAAMTNFNAGY